LIKNYAKMIFIYSLYKYIVAIFRWDEFQVWRKKIEYKHSFRSFAFSIIKRSHYREDQRVLDECEEKNLTWTNRSITVHDTHVCSDSTEPYHGLCSRPPLVSRFLMLLFSDLSHSFFVDYINFCLSNSTLFLCHYLMNYVLSFFDRAYCNRKN